MDDEHRKSKKIPNPMPKKARNEQKSIGNTKDSSIRCPNWPETIKKASETTKYPQSDATCLITHKSP